MNARRTSAVGQTWTFDDGRLVFLVVSERRFRKDERTNRTVLILTYPYSVMGSVFAAGSISSFDVFAPFAWENSDLFKRIA